MTSLLSRPGSVQWKATDTQHPDNSIWFLDLEGGRMLVSTLIFQEERASNPRAPALEATAVRRAG
jgi:hypothetical protein